VQPEGQNALSAGGQQPLMTPFWVMQMSLPVQLTPQAPQLGTASVCTQLPPQQLS